MTRLRLPMAACLMAGLAMVLQAEQGAGRGAGQGGGRAGGAAAGGAPIGGTLTPAMPDARGWGWQVKASINPNTPRPFYNRAKELLLQDKQITSYTMSSYNPELYCEVRQALRLHLVRDAAQHDVVGRGAADDAGLPRRRRRGADDPHARRARVDDPEGHRPRRHRRHRPDGGRCPRGARRGAVLALPAGRPPQLRRRLVRPGVAGRQLPRHGQRQHARRRHDRDARGRRQRRGDRRDARRRRRDDRQQRSLELLRVAAERPALSGRPGQGARRRAEVRQVLRQRGRPVSERLRRSAPTRAWSRTDRHATAGRRRAAAAPVAARRPQGAAAATARPSPIPSRSSGCPAARSPATSAPARGGRGQQ